MNSKKFSKKNIRNLFGFENNLDCKRTKYSSACKMAYKRQSRCLSVEVAITDIVRVKEAQVHGYIFVDAAKAYVETPDFVALYDLNTRAVYTNVDNSAYWRVYFLY